MSKLRVITNFEKLDPIDQRFLLDSNPYGFDKQIITFTDHKGRIISAFPFETDERIYMVRMTSAKARKLLLKDQAEEEIIEIVNTEDIDIEDVEEIPDVKKEVEASD